MKNGFTFRKVRSKRYSAETMTDANYADDLALHAITPAQAESLLHSTEWGSRRH